jgi:copper chaperone CopZ
MLNKDASKKIVRPPALILLGAFFLQLTFTLTLTLSAAFAASSLHRADMRITGSSCATCLIRLEKKLRETPGVLKVVVSIYKPFNASVIYDKSKTDWPKIDQTLQSESVKAADFKDVSVDKVPLILEPSSK